MTYSIHSPNDADLLVKFMEEIQKVINNNDEIEWNIEHNPLTETDEQKSWAKDEGRSVWYYTIDVNSTGAVYANHSGVGVNTIILTPENFTETLKTVFSK